jgi:hypothetical protein
MHQDAVQGQAFGIIDVEETLSESCLGYLEHLGVEPERVVVCDPTATEATLPLNFLHVPEGAHPHVVIEDLVFAMRRAWADVWGPRLDDILRHSLALLQEHRLTLAELPLLLSDKKFRETLAEQSKDERLRLFFISHLGNVPAREWRVWIEAVRNKASAFAGNPFVTPMIAADTCVDFRSIMDEGKFLVVNLPERVLKDSGKLLGMMLVTRIYAAALQRPEGSLPWFLYADEFQSIASRSFLDLVTRSRKRGVGVIVAHQNLTQPPFDRDPGFLDTVLANCATQCFFSVGRTDAERLAKEVFPATGTIPKKTKKKDALWGGDEVQSFYSVSEEREHAIHEMETQQPRECFIKLKGGDTYVATTYDLPEAGDGSDLARASVRLHGVPPESIVARRIERLASLTPQKGKRGRFDPSARPSEDLGLPADPYAE